MQSFLITPQTEQELNFLQELFAKMRLKVTVLDEEEKEDIAMYAYMMEADRTQKVPGEVIMQKLKRYES